MDKCSSTQTSGNLSHKPLAEFEGKKVEWLPGDRFKIPRGKLTLVVGDPGNGKSFVRPRRAEWVSVHRAVATDGGTDHQSWLIHFYHFHGLDTVSRTLELGWDSVYQWARKHSQKSYHDAHVSILKSTDLRYAALHHPPRRY